MTPSCHPLAESAPSLDVVLFFLTALTVSLGHCVGMCGPLQTAFSVQVARRGASGWRLFPPLLRYHLGRVIGYGLIGALLGLVGSAARDSSRAGP